MSGEEVSMSKPNAMAQQQPSFGGTVEEAVKQQSESIQEFVNIWSKILEINESNTEDNYHQINTYIKLHPLNLTRIYSEIVYCAIIRNKQIRSLSFLFEELVAKHGKSEIFKSIEKLDSSSFNRSYTSIRGIFVPFDQNEVTKNDSILNALYCDDLDRFQRIASIPDFDYQKMFQFPHKMIRLDFSSPDQYSLLQFCAFYGSINCFKYIIMNGVAPDEITCLFAICGGNNEIIHIHVQENFEFLNCSRIAMIYHRNSLFNWLLLHYQCEELLLADCLEFQNEPLFFFTLCHNGNINPTGNGKAPLTCACKNGLIEIVELLISQGAEINTGSYETPISTACNKGFIEIVKLLISKGADVNGNYEYGTPLHEASCHGNVEIAKLLISKGADVNARLVDEDTDQTPLGLACSNGYAEMAELLISNGANVNLDIVVKPLHWACICKHLNIVKLLLSKGADIEAIENDGYYNSTPLFLACERNNFDIVQYLVLNGANVNAVASHTMWQSGEDVTPLHVACHQGYAEIVELLLSNGANTKAKDKTGLTAIELTNDTQIKQIFSKYEK